MEYAAGAADYGTKALYALDTPFTELAKGNIRKRGPEVQGFINSMWDAYDRKLTELGEKRHGLAKATSGKERRAAAEAAKTPEQRRKEMDAFVGSYLKRLFQGGAAVGGAGKNIFDAFTGTGKRSAPFLKYMFDTKAAPKISMEERKPDTSFAFAQTAVKGSLEAYRTIARSMGGGGADPMLKEQRKGVQLLGRIEKNTRNDGGDGVQAVAIPA